MYLLHILVSIPPECKPCERKDMSYSQLYPQILALFRSLINVFDKHRYKYGDDSVKNFFKKLKDRSIFYVTLLTTVSFIYLLPGINSAYTKMKQNVFQGEKRPLSSEMEPYVGSLQKNMAYQSNICKEIKDQQASHSLDYVKVRFICFKTRYSHNS